MKDLRPGKKILGLKITRDRSKKLLWLSQEQYIEKVLKRFNMHKAKLVSIPLAVQFKLSKKQSPTSEGDKEEMKKVPYSSVVGSLIYAMICTRPNIAYAVGVMNWFLSNPRKEHWGVVKWIFRYLGGTIKRCLCFGNGKLVLEGYTNMNTAGDVDSRNWTSRYLTTFVGGLCHGKPNFKSVWLYQLLRLNILQLPKHAKRCCGWRIFFMSCAMNNKIIWCTVIIKFHTPS